MPEAAVPCEASLEMARWAQAAERTSAFLIFVFSSSPEHTCHVRQNTIVLFSNVDDIKDSVVVCCSCLLTASILQGWSVVFGLSCWPPALI